MIGPNPWRHEAFEMLQVQDMTLTEAVEGLAEDLHQAALEMGLDCSGVDFDGIAQPVIDELDGEYFKDES